MFRAPRNRTPLQKLQPLPHNPELPRDPQQLALRPVQLGRQLPAAALGPGALLPGLLLELPVFHQEEVHVAVLEAEPAEVFPAYRGRVVVAPAVAAVFGGGGGVDVGGGAAAVAEVAGVGVCVVVEAGVP